MATTNVKKVLELKLQLKENTEGQTLLKTLKKLQELDITLDILAETGIGKVVNSFRKHGDAGEVAKTLVHQWKKLVPKDQSSATLPLPSSPSKPSKSEVLRTGKEEDSQASDTSGGSERKPKNESSGSEFKSSKNTDSKSKVKLTLHKSKDGTDNEIKDGAKKDSETGHISQTAKKSKSKEKFSSDRPAKGKDEDKHKPEKKGSDKDLPKKTKHQLLNEEDSLERKGKKKEGSNKKVKDKEKKRNKKRAEIEKDSQEEEEETPSMSFEAYLSYDLSAPKRKKKSCGDKKSKRFKTDHKQDDRGCVSTTTSSSSEAPTSTVSKGSVMDLLKIPLPTISPECEDLSQYQYFTEKKVEEKAVSVCEEAPVFTGQRLNKKMQVYSGSKVTFLPNMLTLYQQCIRTLQNNIDSIYEIGGVPFEILEPVLERCTPEQLLRIEECNPVYIGVTDHLWERHCHRDFRNTQLEEYESWREMYVRLSEERERKLQQLTKSIVSAHSGKPKGRQVKMAFIHSAAKPPRNIRIQQELHGTAGLSHPTDKASGRSHDSKGRPCFSESIKPSSSGSSQSQDPRKIRRVAPMMAKSLKAFRKQLGRR